MVISEELEGRTACIHALARLNFHGFSEGGRKKEDSNEPPFIYNDQAFPCRVPPGIPR